MTNSTKGFLMDKRFTVNMNGETGGEIVGDFEYYDDGKRRGLCLQGMQSDHSGQQLLKMLDPQKYADEDRKLAHK